MGKIIEKKKKRWGKEEVAVSFCFLGSLKYTQPLRKLSRMGPCNMLAVAVSDERGISQPPRENPTQDTPPPQ